MRMRWLCAAGLLSLVFAGCSSSGSGSAAGGGGGAAGSGATGGGGAAGSGATGGLPPADGPFPCGDITCAATDVCVHPCCGGAPPPCEPKPEAGACSAGTHDGCDFGQCTDPGGCCTPDPCTPLPPYCASPAAAGCMQASHDCYLACA